MRKKFKQKDGRETKMTNTGQKIAKNPRIALVTDQLLLKEESCEKIAEILRERYNFETSGQTVRAYLAKCYNVLSAEDEVRFRDILTKLLESKSDGKKEYIKEIATMSGFLTEVLDKINKEVKILSDLQEFHSTTASNAVAIANLLKLMIEVRKEIDMYVTSFDTQRIELLDNIFVEIIKFFKDSIFPVIQQEQRKELTVKFKSKLKDLQDEYGPKDFYRVE